MLWKVLAEKIAPEGVGSGRERGYRLRGAPHVRPRGRTGSQLVAPTGFGSQASLFELTFEGLALAA
jgi:hypothetical protein